MQQISCRTNKDIRHLAYCVNFKSPTWTGIETKSGDVCASCRFTGLYEFSLDLFSSPHQFEL